MLTEQQLDDVKRLRERLLALCKSGKVDEARRCQELALRTIRTGAPVKE